MRLKVQFPFRNKAIKVFSVIDFLNSIQEDFDVVGGTFIMFQVIYNALLPWEVYLR